MESFLLYIFSLMLYFCVMKKENLYEPFEIIYERVNECPIRERVFNFFQLVYIVSGRGKQNVNNNTTNYKSGNLFLLVPNDCHSFEVETTTEFLLIRFNNIYIQNKSFQSVGVQRLEFIIQNANHQPGCILYNVSDRLLARAIIEAVIREHINRDLYNKELIQQLINTLILIIARNVAESLPEQVNETTEQKALEILQYIQSNIYHPEKIRVVEVSKYFNVSENYLGRYFKKHTNETMQQYVSNYKTKLIENRLLHSDMRMKEICEEMGFTDESHLNKFFRKQKGVNPTKYREIARFVS